MVFPDLSLLTVESIFGFTRSIDNLFPYLTAKIINNQKITYDNPGLGTLYNQSQSYVNEHFDMYTMFRSAGGQWVPLFVIP
jgi:hypothetical protein